MNPHQSEKQNKDEIQRFTQNKGSQKYNLCNVCSQEQDQRNELEKRDSAEKEAQKRNFSSLTLAEYTRLLKKMDSQIKTNEKEIQCKEEFEKENEILRDKVAKLETEIQCMTSNLQELERECRESKQQAEEFRKQIFKLSSQSINCGGTFPLPMELARNFRNSIGDFYDFDYKDRAIIAIQCAEEVNKHNDYIRRTFMDTLKIDDSDHKSKLFLQEVMQRNYLSLVPSGVVEQLQKQLQNVPGFVESTTKLLNILWAISLCPQLKLYWPIDGEPFRQSHHEVIDGPFHPTHIEIIFPGILISETNVVEVKCQVLGKEMGFNL